jgi:hypothetical protein
VANGTRTAGNHAASSAFHDLRTWRSADVRVFSSTTDAPRARRPTDVALLAGAFLTVLGVALVAPGPTAVHTAMGTLHEPISPMSAWFGVIAYDLLYFWTILLLTAAATTRGRHSLLREQLLAEPVSVGAAALAGRVAGATWQQLSNALVAARWRRSPHSRPRGSGGSCERALGTAVLRSGSSTHAATS